MGRSKMKAMEESNHIEIKVQVDNWWSVIKCWFFNIMGMAMVSGVIMFMIYSYVNL